MSLDPNQELFQKAKLLCAQHLRGRWANVNDISAEILPGGNMNKVIVCWILDHDDNQVRIVNKVIVRLFHVQFVERSAGEAGQAVALEALHRAGLGPRLLGVFPEGRIEQFVPSRNSDYRDARNVSTLRTIARITARMHSLNVPLKQDPNVFVNNLKQYFARTLKERENIDLTKFDQEVQEKATRLLNFDLIKELDEVLEMMSGIKSHSVMSHFDHHANNLIVKNSDDGQVKEDDVLIIDMDMITYYHRGMDIGCFLLESSFDYSDITSLKFADSLPESSWRTFVTEYLDLWKELNPNEFDSKADTVDNVLAEAHLLSTIFSITMIDLVLDILNKSNSLAQCTRDFLSGVADHRLRMVAEQKQIASKLLAKLHN